MLDKDGLDTALKVIEKAKEKGIELLLPVDNIIADAFSNDANTKVCGLGEIPAGWEGLDIGPKTLELFSEAVKKAATVVWNGPLGVFEMENFAKGIKGFKKGLGDDDVSPPKQVEDHQKKD